MIIVIYLNKDSQAFLVKFTTTKFNNMSIVVVDDLTLNLQKRTRQFGDGEEAEIPDGR